MKHPIPEAALKKHIAILGMNGSGKTSVAKSEIIEPALEAGERVCNIDPTGVGWGLRLSATGKSKGFSIYIVGGSHADFPLFKRDGKAWGEIVGTSSDSFIFDTSQMTVTDRSVWWTDFAETLLRLNRGPLKLVIDEAHLFAPQGGAKGGGATPDMLHATNNLLSLGRSRGLRITMISQRPAKLHKDSLTQAHTLIAMSLMAPHDRQAVSDWIADQADVARGKEIVASLPSLEPGEGWLWAPREKVLERVKFSRPRTFDSSSAPDDGDTEGPSLPAMNPDAIKSKLETVAKETVANDPAKLRAELTKLKAELAKAAKPVPMIGVDPKEMKAQYERGYQIGHADALKATLKITRQATSALEHIAAMATKNATEIAAILPESGKVKMAEFRPPPVRAPLAVVTPRQSSSAAAGTASLPRGEKACLVCAAQQDGGATREQLTVVTGYKRSSRDAYVQRLREKGYIQADGDRIVATQEGIDALGSDYEPMPTGDALREFHLRRLPEGERRVLELLISVHPDGTSREAIDEATGYKRSSRDAYLQRLSSRQLVTSAGRGEVRASDQLFQ